MTTQSSTYSARQLAERFGLVLHGDGAIRIAGVSTLVRAASTQLAFLANPRYRGQLDHTAAGVVVLRAADATGYPGTALLADDPYVAFARI
ncbi:MAG TPA: LpxD N-terminal domain-containing protein, partial [Lysobacter sp.]|nr:LpxD N-terminal domain-containing protein [Lysobacter sp.]